MKTGSIIDFYDDPAGNVLQQKIPGDLPDFIKTASCLDDQQRERLPDDVYALVMLDQGEPIRKYACVDKGNTALSVIYFLENRHKLPEGAQKTAAANLLTACSWYEMQPPPQLEKIALLGGLAKAVIKNPMKTLQAGMGASQVKGKIQQGAERYSASLLPKMGELSGTKTMPRQSDRPEDEEKIAKAQSLLDAYKIGRITAGAKTIEKSLPNKLRGLSDFGHAVSEGAGHLHGLPRAALHLGQHRDKYLGGALVAGGVAAGRASKEKSASLQPYVDITGQEPPDRFEKVASQRTLLNGQFPVDSYGEVTQARQWFEDYGDSLHPSDRREYCTKLASRAEELGVEIPYTIEKYAGVGYAPDDEIEVAVATRMQFWAEDSPERDMLKSLMEKRAGVQPEVFCEALRQFDELTNIQHYWDTGIYDPWYSTFGKTAGTGWTFEHMGDRVDEEMLKHLSIAGHKNLCRTFGKELAEEFRKSPKAIFSSLPLDSKRIIMRMANDPQP